MRKILWMGIVVIAAMIGSANAQIACGGGYDAPGGSCTFECQKGDRIMIEGVGCYRSFYGCYETTDVINYVNVRASCGGVTVSCFDVNQGCGRCQHVSDETASSGDKNGTCVVEGDCGNFSCRSVTPEEAAESEASWQGILIKIPEQ